MCKSDNVKRIQKLKSKMCDSVKRKLKINLQSVWKRSRFTDNKKHKTIEISSKTKFQLQITTKTQNDDKSTTTKKNDSQNLT